jgi:hypothetical protein
MTYIFRMWAPGDIQFEIVDEDTDHPIVTIEISTPVGLVLVMAEASMEGQTLWLRGVHAQSDAGPNALGIANLRLIADLALEKMGYDEIIVEGAIRTTGARPGRIPKPLRFTRRGRNPASS